MEAYMLMEDLRRMEQEFQVAIKNREFHVWYQPQLDMRTGKHCGAEALIRWNHPKKGLIAPAQFIPVLEKNGFIEKLDYYVWEKVCQYIRKWIDAGRHRRLSLSICPGSTAPTPACRTS